MFWYHAKCAHLRLIRQHNFASFFCGHSCIGENSEAVFIIGKRRQKKITPRNIMFAFKTCHAFIASFPAFRLDYVLVWAWVIVIFACIWRNVAWQKNTHNRAWNVGEMKVFFSFQCLKASLILDNFSSERLSFSVSL